MTEVFDGIYGGLHEGGIKRNGSMRRTVENVGPVLAKFDQISGICGEVETVMFVTSSEWEKLACAVQLLTKQVNPQNFRRLKLRNLTVVNSGSEDQEACNLLNVPEADKCDFQNRRQRLISGRNS